MEDCRVEEGESCIYFKSNRDRGGFIENVRVRRIQVGLSRAAVIRFETNYQGYRGGTPPTAYRDFVVEDVHADVGSNPTAGPRRPFQSLVGDGNSSSSGI
jgi:xylan 1,4-beta-xylosidase